MLGAVVAIGNSRSSGPRNFSPMSLKRFASIGLSLTAGNSEGLASGDILVSSQNMPSGIRDGGEQAFWIAKIAPGDAFDRQNRELRWKCSQHAGREIRRRKMTIDALQDFGFGSAAKEGPNVGEGRVHFRERFGDQAEQRRRVRDKNEAVPKIVAVVQLERDLARRFLKEAANSADLAAAGRWQQQRSALLDPSVLSLGTVGRNSQQHRQLRRAVDRAQRGVDMVHKEGVVADVVIRGKDCDWPGVSRLSKAEQRAQDGRGSAAIVGLDEQIAGRSSMEERCVKLPMRAVHHGQGLRWRDQHRDSTRRLLEQGPALEQRTELLGQVIAENFAGERAEAYAVASSEYQCGVSGVIES